METLLAIGKRRSARRFKPGALDPEVIKAVVNAGRMAPSAMNQQPWTFVVVSDPVMLRRLGQLTDHGQFLGDAGACVAVFCRAGRYYLEDGCAAVMLMLLAATDLGLASCWVAGDKKSYAPAVSELLGAGADQRLVAIVALGLLADDEQEPSVSRRTLDEVLCWHRFPASASSSDHDKTTPA